LPFSELPWDQPSSSCTEFINWKDNDHWQLQTPWSKLDTLAISLLRKLLATSPGTRLTLEKTLDHKWCNMQFADNGRTFSLFKVHMNQCLYRCKCNQAHAMAQVLSDSQCFRHLGTRSVPALPVRPSLQTIVI